MLIIILFVRMCVCLYIKVDLACFMNMILVFFDYKGKWGDIDLNDRY